MLTSELLTRVAGGAENLILLALTIGSALDDSIKEALDSGDVLEGYTLNAAGSVYVNKFASAVVTELTERYRAAGQGVTFTMAPGQPYWLGTEDIGKIVSSLGADKIGLSVTESNLMRPTQSITLVMGAGVGLADFGDQALCDFCSLEKDCAEKNTKNKC